MKLLATPAKASIRPLVILPKHAFFLYKSNISLRPSAIEWPVMATKYFVNRKSFSFHITDNIQIGILRKYCINLFQSVCKIIII